MFRQWKNGNKNGYNKIYIKKKVWEISYNKNNGSGNKYIASDK